MPGSYTPPPDATVVPIALFGTQPQFACGIDDVPATCTLDTGASSSLSFYTPFLQAHPSVVPTRVTEPGVNGFGVGGPTHGRLGRLQTLSFGGLTLHDLVGDYPAQGEGGYDLPFFGANVGGGVWKRFTMTCAGAGSTCFVANSIWPNRWWSIIGVPLSIAAIVAFFIK
jgi:Aspartyl protease